MKAVGYIRISSPISLAPKVGRSVRVFVTQDYRAHWWLARSLASFGATSNLFAHGYVSEPSISKHLTDNSGKPKSRNRFNNP